MSPTSPESDSQRRRKAGVVLWRQEYAARMAADETMAASHEVYRSARWRILRLIHLGREPLCRRCFAHGETITPGVVVDHVVPLRIDITRAYDDTNLQSLCIGCHNVKTAQEDRVMLAARAASQRADAQTPGVGEVQSIPYAPVPSDVVARYVDSRGTSSRYHRR